mmetsp:Transcript_16111/g.23827  ORF Transcript_16111/g.23827 Transcript_16111/m.23827 type:complete len:94 (-) Transcript_16111:138-419(-)
MILSPSYSCPNVHVDEYSDPHNPSSATTKHIQQSNGQADEPTKSDSAKSVNSSHRHQRVPTRDTTPRPTPVLASSPKRVSAAYQQQCLMLSFL